MGRPQHRLRKSRGRTRETNPFAEAKKNARALNSAEIFLIPASFQAAIDVSKIRLIKHHHNVFVKNKIMTRNYDIWWPDCPEDFTKIISINLMRDSQAKLMHELCHVWQYKTGRLSIGKYITNPSRWTYRYGFSPDKSFDDYPTEKQADFFEDWWRLNMGYPADNNKVGTQPPSKKAINKTIPFKW